MNPPSPEDQQPWTPPGAPSADRGEQIRMAAQRYGFPVLVLLLVVGLAAAWYWQANAPTAAEEEEARIQAAIEAYQSGERPAVQDGPDPLGTLSSSDRDQNGTITVRSRPTQATVRVDDDSVGVTPLARYALEPGVYFVTVERDGYAPVDTLLIVRNDNAPSFTAVLQRQRQRPSTSTSRQPPRRTSPARTQSEPPSTSRAPATRTNPRGATSSPEGAVASPQVPDASASGSDPAPEPSTGRLRFVTDPAGATVRIDGERVGTTPLTLEDLPAGSLGAVLYRSGYDTVQTQVEVAAGTERVVQQALTPLPGRLRVLVQPWGSVYVDGTIRQRNTDVWFETTLPAGTHEVTAVHPALGRQTRRIQIDPGAEQSVVIDLRAAPEAPPDSASNAPGDAEG